MKKVGDKVSYLYDTGAFGYQSLYGVVTKAGPKTFTVKWESHICNRIKQLDTNVRFLRPDEVDYVNELLKERGVL